MGQTTWLPAALGGGRQILITRPEQYVMLRCRCATFSLTSYLVRPSHCSPGLTVSWWDSGSTQLSEVFVDFSTRDAPFARLGRTPLPVVALAIMGSSAAMEIVEEFSCGHCICVA